MKSPTSRKKVYRFIGLVNSYYDMREILSHTLAPLTKITPSKVKWSKTEQDAFKGVKWIVARDNL